MRGFVCCGLRQHTKPPTGAFPPLTHQDSYASHATGTKKAAAKTCLLLDLSHDEVSIVTHELCDPLQPLLAVHLSSTAKGLREAMEEQLAELKQHRQRLSRCGPEPG